MFFLCIATESNEFAHQNHSQYSLYLNQLKDAYESCDSPVKNPQVNGAVWKS